MVEGCFWIMLIKGFLLTVPKRSQKVVERAKESRERKKIPLMKKRKKFIYTLKTTQYKPWLILTITECNGKCSFSRKLQTVKTVITAADLFLPKRPNNPLA